MLARFRPSRVAVSRTALGAYIDEVLQAFEDSRAGLKNADLDPQDGRAEEFFLEIFAREQPRLASAIQMIEPGLSGPQRQALVQETSRFFTKVLIPGYARMAAAFTRSERRDFFFTEGPMRAVERAGWVVGGLLLGGFLVWAPFIPLWSKHWIWLSGLGGLFYPEIRRVVVIKRYERELNLLVTRSDREISRLREAYLIGDSQVVAELTSGSSEEKL